MTLLWAMALLMPLEAQTVPPPVVTVYFSERPPFSIVEGQTGILISLTKAILSEAGIRPRFIELPAPRILELLKGSQSDALGLGWYKIPGKTLPGRFSLPIYQEQPSVAVMNSRAAAALGTTVRLESLLASNFTLGLKAGDSLGPVLDQKVRAQGLVPLETVVGIPSMLKLIQAGRMDYTLLSEEEAQYLMRKDPSLVPGLVVTRLADAPPGNLRYFLFPDGFDPLLAARIDTAIEKLKTQARSPGTSRPLQAPGPALVNPPAPLKP